MIALLIVYIASGLLMSGLALPLMWRKVPPNHLYGFRVRRTLEDEAVWYAVNEFLGELKAAEMVFPCGRRLPDQAPVGPANEIREYCQKFGLDVRR